MLTSVLKSVLTPTAVVVTAVVVVVILAIAAVWAMGGFTKMKKEPFVPLGRLIRRVVDPSPQCTFAQCIECHGGATLRRTALGVPTCCVKFDGEKCGVCEYVDARGRARIQISDSCPASVRKLYA
jgi:hypothetical protein